MSAFRILYLDNNYFVASQIKMRLEWNGYHVTTTHKEQELLTKIANQSYDLLIVDLLTPTPNAFSLLECLKGRNILTPPMIIVSENNDYHEVAKAIQSGCMDYVIKKPLIQNFFDQINLSVFQALEKLKQQQAENNKPNPIATCSNGKAASTQLTNERHYPTQPPFQSTLQKNPTFNNYKIKQRITDIVSPNEQVETIPSDQLNDQNLRLKLSFFDNTADAIFITNAKRQIITINNAFTTLCGYPSHEILKKEAYILNAGKFDTDFFNNIAKKLKNEPFWQGEVLIRHYSGHFVPVWQSIFILKDAVGNISQSISILRDIRQQKAYENEIKFQANYDSLTQLPNRSLFLDRLTNAIKLAKRNNSKLALMLLDLNKFKWINDKLGHHAGDQLLQETARKLQTAVRNVDTVARLGGDEFSIIIPDLVKSTDAELIVRKIFNAFKEPIFIDQHEIFISGCIGITIFPNDGNNSTTLQKNADRAMYMAKNSGRNGYVYFTQALQQKTEKRLQLISDMRSAMLNQEFSLHYQPIIDVITKKVCSAETLLRWNHPESGQISLNKFIPLAEESGLIREIGHWVMEQVANNIHYWLSLGLPPMQISLNQSVAEYSLPQCHIDWLNILKNKKIPVNSIAFEISEKIFNNENNNYVNSIKKLQQEGIQISLDGFGSGYTSLNYLKKLTIDAIKIDRTYIQSMADDPTHAIFVETIILLANKLGIKVIATGIENQKQLALLKQQCRYAQGYFFSKPLPFDEFITYTKIQNQL